MKTCTGKPLTSYWSRNVPRVHDDADSSRWCSLTELRRLCARSRARRRRRLASRACRYSRASAVDRRSLFVARRTPRREKVEIDGLPVQRRQRETSARGSARLRPGSAPDDPTLGRLRRADDPALPAVRAGDQRAAAAAARSRRVPLSIARIADRRRIAAASARRVRRLGKKPLLAHVTQVAQRELATVDRLLEIAQPCLDGARAAAELRIRSDRDQRRDNRGRRSVPPPNRRRLWEAASPAR